MGDVMPKKVTTVRLDEELYEKIQKSDMKNTELFTKAIEHYFSKKNTKKIRSEQEKHIKNEYVPNKKEYEILNYFFDELLEQLRQENKYLKEQNSRFIDIVEVNTKNARYWLEDIKITTDKKQENQNIRLEGVVSPPKKEYNRTGFWHRFLG
jgi:hypothetical protein